MRTQNRYFISGVRKPILSSDYSDFLKRFDTYGFNKLLDDNLFLEILKNENFSLYTAMSQFKRLSQKKQRHTMISVYGYLSRMLYRATPRNLLSYISSPFLSSTIDSLRYEVFVSPSGSALKRIQRLFLKDESLFKHCKVIRNPALIKRGKYLCALEMHKSIVETNELIDLVMKHCTSPINIGLLIRFLRTKGLDTARTFDFLRELVENKLLIVSTCLADACHEVRYIKYILRITPQNPCSMKFACLVNQLVRLNSKPITGHSLMKVVQKATSAELKIQNKLRLLTEDDDFESRFSVLKLAIVDHQNSDADISKELSTKQMRRIADLICFFGQKNDDMSNRIEDLDADFCERYGEYERISLKRYLTDHEGIDYENKPMFSPSASLYTKILSDWLRMIQDNSESEEIVISDQQVELVHQLYSKKSTCGEVFVNKIEGLKQKPEYLISNTSARNFQLTSFMHFHPVISRQICTAAMSKIDNCNSWCVFRQKYLTGVGDSLRADFASRVPKLSSFSENIYTQSNDASVFSLYIGRDDQGLSLFDVAGKPVFLQFGDSTTPILGDLSIYRLIRLLFLQHHIDLDSSQILGLKIDYCPRLKWGDIVLRPRTWRFEKLSILGATFTEFVEHFKKKSLRLSLPNNLILKGEDGKDLHFSVDSITGQRACYKSIKKSKNLFIYLSEDLLRDRQEVDSKSLYGYDARNEYVFEIFEEGHRFTEGENQGSQILTKEEFSQINDWERINMTIPKYLKFLFLKDIKEELVQLFGRKNWFYTYKEISSSRVIISFKIKCQKKSTLLSEIITLLNKYKRTNLIYDYTIQNFSPESSRYCLDNIKLEKIAYIFKIDSIQALLESTRAEDPDFLMSRALQTFSLFKDLAATKNQKTQKNLDEYLSILSEEFNKLYVTGYLNLNHFFPIDFMHMWFNRRLSPEKEAAFWRQVREDY
ncbi:MULTISPECIES: lantibiotic dehydratase [Lacticaseibacillus]|uniref:lantibiotic dehydratase n=1 Tax=Lacticaseibacillus TaxID=2759736 RepID=UPI00063DBD8F|nr:MULTISPECIES: lantibiotic dehydratase [Lacticaseibacillus]KLI76523.1 hypothetical protein AAW28_04945 [Lacticaseibacillus casei]